MCIQTFSSQWYFNFNLIVLNILEVKVSSCRVSDIHMKRKVKDILRKGAFFSPDFYTRAKVFGHHEKGIWVLFIREIKNIVLFCWHISLSSVCTGHLFRPFTLLFVNLIKLVAEIICFSCNKVVWSANIWIVLNS